MTAMASSRTAKLTLPTERQILITRHFNAPKHLVYEAFTKPEHVRRWWHARRGEIIDVEADVRVGGRYRYAMTATSNGQEVAFNGEYHEVVANERIVSSEYYEGAPGAPPSHNTATFIANADGTTTLELLMELPDQQTRDMIIATGMEDGLQDALDLLEELAIELR